MIKAHCTWGQIGVPCTACVKRGSRRRLLSLTGNKTIREPGTMVGRNAPNRLPSQARMVRRPIGVKNGPHMKGVLARQQASTRQREGAYDDRQVRHYQVHPTVTTRVCDEASRFWASPRPKFISQIHDGVICNFCDCPGLMERSFVIFEMRNLRAIPALKVVGVLPR